MIYCAGLCKLQVRFPDLPLETCRLQEYRRDKIRCDGARFVVKSLSMNLYSLIDTSFSRPCGGCAKKGYSVEQCIDGCEPCRRARVRCEDGKPCQRCRTMQLECRDEATMPTLRPSTPPVAPRSVRGGADRAKLACSSCRRDNKKVLPGFERLSIESLGSDPMILLLLVSAMISVRVRDVSRARKSAYMLDAVRNSSSYVAKVVERITNAVKTPDHVSIAWRVTSLAFLCLGREEDMGRG